MTDRPMAEPGPGRKRVTVGVLELLNALGGKHAQVNLQLRSVTFELVGTPWAICLNGTVSANVLLSELTDSEREALRGEGAATPGL